MSTATNSTHRSPRRRSRQDRSSAGSTAGIRFRLAAITIRTILGYRSLRVINDDIVEPASGFGEHGHDNMEILTWVLEGTLHHRTAPGSDGDLRPGELQAMTAGRGIRHSEVNDSPTERVHLLQIWLEPDTLNLEPAYGQKTFPAEGRSGQWQTLASPDGRNESMRIHQDAVLSVADLSADRQVRVARAWRRIAMRMCTWRSARSGRRHDAEIRRRAHVCRPGKPHLHGERRKSDTILRPRVITSG